MTPDTTRATPTTDETLTATIPADSLRTVLDAVAVFVDECVVRFDAEGLAVDAIDPATVGMVSLELSADAFESYDAADAALGVDLSKLSDVVGMAGSGDPVHLSLLDETRQLEVRVDELEYTLALVDPAAIRSPPDSTDFSEQYTTTVGVDGATLGRGIRAATMVSDHLAVGVDADRDRFYARAEGDTDSVDFEVAREECSAFESTGAHSLFSLDYLSDVNRVVPSDADVRVRLGEEAPMELAFDFAAGDGTVRYALAPRLVNR